VITTEVGWFTSEMCKGLTQWNHQDDHSATLNSWLSWLLCHEVWTVLTNML